MEIVSFRGFVFADHGFSCSIPRDGAQGQWGMIPAIAARINDAGEIAGLRIDPRPIPTTVTYGPGGPLTFQKAWFYLMGRLNPLDAEPGELVARTNDGLLVSCEAIITSPGALTPDVNMISIVFLTTDPMWRALTATTAGPVSVAKGSYGGFDDVVIAGDAPVHGRIRLTPTAADQQVTVRMFSVTNNRPSPMVKFPIKVAIPNTYNASPPPVFYHALLRDGVPQPSELVNYHGRHTYLWMVVDYLAPGEHADYMLLVSDTYLMPGTAFNSTTAPAFDIRWEARTTSATGTATVHQFSGVAWETDQWRGGHMIPGTGPAVGVHTILSNTATTITTAALLGGALGSGIDVLLTMSSNGKWVYPVRQTERNQRQRGLWWINQGQKKPGDARFDVPGAWRPWLYYDNEDIKSQKDWTPVTGGSIGSSADYFAILDANRSYPGGSSLQDNGADGVSISLPVPITGLRFTYQLKNPNGMATFVVGSRESGGALGFIHEFTDDGPYATLTNRPEQNLTLTDDAVQLYLGLIPTTVGGVVEDEIGERWSGDDGTATSGSTSTLNDNTKAWISDQWIGATVRILSGTGAGQSATITDNSPMQLTASFSTAPDSTSRYRIIQKRGLVSTVRTNDYLELRWDTSDLLVTTPNSSAAGYIIDRTLYIDRPTASAGPPYQRVRFDPDDTGRYIVLLASESLVIDGAEMRAWIESSAGDELSAVSPRAVLVHDVEAGGTERLAERWLWLTPGEHDIKLAAKSDGNSYDMELIYTPAIFG